MSKRKTSSSLKLNWTKTILGILTLVFFANSVGAQDKPEGVSSAQLWEAARFWKVETVKSLVNAGADVNVRGMGATTPLICASWRDHPDKQQGNAQLEVVSFLLEKGAEVDAKDAEGRTALMITPAPTIAAFLLEKGANVNARDNRGRTPLMWQCHPTQAGHIFKDAKRHPRTVELLLEKGAELDAKDNDGITALMQASWPTIAALLLERGANINAVDNNGRTPLMWQASLPGKNFRGHTLTVELLLKKGANPNAVDNDGKTALIWACQKGNRASVELLLKHGVDVNHKDKSGINALGYSKSRKRKELLPHGQKSSEQLLLEHGATP